ncbi:hypothetical protein [Bradyrhizobium liaoningense]|uniref:hypothetical protein n=1 Tax=Bradyrhizobium liaoningense TaxID=43992 RepID=UPI001BAA5A12|nr:hypothetical protein [Bradyrhizobium liaoningense]MBR1069140.1 hypothetical protein [Bradyrhizobium liaoningense]
MKALIFDGTAIHIEDSTEIGLFQQLPSIEAFQLRARARATKGEVVISGEEPPEGYEDYNANYLGLGQVEWLRAREGAAISRSAWETTKCFQRLVEIAHVGPTYIHPYMASADVWELADRLSIAVDRPIGVLGPPPALCKAINDKIFFYKLIEELLGPSSTVPWAFGDDIPTITTRVGEFANRYDRIAIRIANSTAGLGLKVFDSSELRTVEKNALEPICRRELASLGWDGVERVLIVKWEQSLKSVSVQMFVTPDGRVVHEGIYEQIFHRDAPFRFRGARRTKLPDATVHRIVRDSTAICSLLRRLGYVGRCSMDAILVGPDAEHIDVRWVDCNGRWGGVSIAHTFMSNIQSDLLERPFVLGSYQDSKLATHNFRSIVNLLGNRLYAPTNGSGTVLIYNIGLLRSKGRLDVVCFTDCGEAASEDVVVDLDDLFER